MLDVDGMVLADGLDLGQVAAAVRRIGLAPDQPVLARLRAVCAVHQPGLPRQAEAIRQVEVISQAEVTSQAEPDGQRSVLLAGGRCDVPVFARDRLRAGHAISGPGLIESSGSTYLIPAGMDGRIDHFGTAVLASRA